MCVRRGEKVLFFSRDRRASYLYFFPLCDVGKTSYLKKLKKKRRRMNQTWQSQALTKVETTSAHSKFILSWENNCWTTWTTCLNRAPLHSVPVVIEPTTGTSREKEEWEWWPLPNEVCGAPRVSWEEKEEEEEEQEEEEAATSWVFKYFCGWVFQKLYSVY